jgi:hypothetical protein
MRKHSTRLRTLVQFGALLTIVATGIVLAAGSAAASRAAIHASAFRLTATLTPSQEVPAVQAPAGAIGHFHGVLFRTGIGTARIASLAGCTVLVPPHRSGLPLRINCGGGAVVLPGAAGQWRLVWRLSVSGLSGPPTAADIHLAAAGHAAAPAFVLCGPCQVATHGMVAVGADQATSLARGDSYVNVDTAAHPSGEIRGQITRTTVGFTVGH